MASHRERLIDKLQAKQITCVFNGDFLNCQVAIQGANGKTKWQKFSFVFDSAEDCQGARLLPRSLKGAYSEVYAERAAEIIFAFSAELAGEEV